MVNDMNAAAKNAAAEVTRTGTATDYALRANGTTVGRIRRRRTADPMVAGPRAYHVSWEAKRGPYAAAVSFETQQAAEAFLVSGELLVDIFKARA
jgi:hypothetical protein